MTEPIFEHQKFHNQIENEKFSLKMYIKNAHAEGPFKIQMDCIEIIREIII